MFITVYLLSSQMKPIKKYWKDKECYKCHRMGHPATHCGKKSNSNDDDESYAAATVNSVKNLQKDIKSIRKAFTTVNTQLEKLKEAEFNISESEGEDIFRWMQLSNSRRSKSNSSQESRNCSSR
jgi:hypothetical protein